MCLYIHALLHLTFLKVKHEENLIHATNDSLKIKSFLHNDNSGTTWLARGTIP